MSPARSARSDGNVLVCITSSVPLRRPDPSLVRLRPSLVRPFRPTSSIPRRIGFSASLGKTLISASRNRSFDFASPGVSELSELSSTIDGALGNLVRAMEFVGSGAAATAASLRSASNGIVMQCAGRFSGRAATTPSSGAPQRTRSVKIVAKIKKGKMGPEEEYPWPDKFPPGEITDGALKYLNRFKPMPNPTKPVTLPFERPIADLENKIDEVSTSPRPCL